MNNKTQNIFHAYPLLKMKINWGVQFEYETNNTQHIHMKIYLVLYILMIMHRFLLGDQFLNQEKSFKRMRLLAEIETICDQL